MLFGRHDLFEPFAGLYDLLCRNREFLFFSDQVRISKDFSNDTENEPSQQDGRQRAAGSATDAPGAIVSRGPREAAIAITELLPAGKATLPSV